MEEEKQDENTLNNAIAQNKMQTPKFTSSQNQGGVSFISLGLQSAVSSKIA